MRFLLMASLVLSSISLTGLARSLDWESSFSQGMVRAKQEWKPVLVDFWASWCGPCQRMDREVYTDSHFRELSDGFVLIEVDVDRFMSTQARYHVTSLPTLLFLDPFGLEIARREGFTRAKDLATIMEAIPADFSSLADVAPLLTPDSRTFTGLFSLAEFYRTQGLLSLSSRHFSEAIDLADSSVSHDLLELAHGKIGLNELASGDRKAAEKTFRRRLEKCPGCPMTPMLLMGLGKTYFEMKKPSKAKQLFEQLVRDYPNSEYAVVARQALDALK
ncbi:MAG: thioredoxin domain-containing protein [Acidobacteriota bacterium]